MEEIGMISSHWWLKSCNSQHAHAEVHIMQTVFTYPLITLQAIHINETPVMAQLTLCHRRQNLWTKADMKVPKILYSPLPET
jgi:hypothetical protein